LKFISKIKALQRLLLLLTGTSPESDQFMNLRMDAMQLNRISDY